MNFGDASLVSPSEYPGELRVPSMGRRGSDGYCGSDSEPLTYLMR